MTKIQIDDDIAWYAISAKSIKEQLDNCSGDIEIEINSGGGSVFEGIAIFNAIKNYDKGEVSITITSLAASIASYIALAGDRLRVYDNSTFMIHNAWTFAAGDSAEFRKAADILDGLTSILKREYVRKTKLSYEDISTMLDDETYLYGEDIVKKGFADEIIKNDKESNEDEAFALSKEAYKATCVKQVQNYNKDEFIQAVAYLEQSGIIDKKEDKKEVKNKNIFQKEQRNREIEILQREFLNDKR